MCRVEQLEEQVSSAQQEAKSARADLASARNDNTRLYEKIRYLQRYSARQKSDTSGVNYVKVDDAGVAQSQVCPVLPPMVLLDSQDLTLVKVCRAAVMY